MKELLFDVFDDDPSKPAPVPVAPAPVARAPVDIAEPTDDEIAAVDTLDVARSLLLTLRHRFKTADEAAAWKMQRLTENLASIGRDFNKAWEKRETFARAMGLR